MLTFNLWAVGHGGDGDAREDRGCLESLVGETVSRSFAFACLRSFRLWVRTAS